MPHPKTAFEKLRTHKFRDEQSHDLVYVLIRGIKRKKTKVQKNTNRIPTTLDWSASVHNYLLVALSMEIGECFI